LNACYAEIQAKAISQHIVFPMMIRTYLAFDQPGRSVATTDISWKVYIAYVIGMNKAIGDKAAIAFSIGFYQTIGAGRSIEDAFQLGRAQIMLQDIPEHLTPVLIKKTG
jgi:hypothetical protein